MVRLVNEAEGRPNYVLISKQEISGVEARDSSKGALLKKVFVSELSPIAKDKGTIEFDLTPANTRGESLSTANYTILESYIALSRKYEADGAPQPDQNPQPETTEDSFRFNRRRVFEFSILVKEEGYTKWKVALDDRVDFDKVKQAINSKKFKEAFVIASDELEGDGIVPLSAHTYVYLKAKAHVPFIGHCRYGFDAGSDDKKEDAYEVVLAVAPIDMVTGKPNEDIVYKVVWDVSGDLGEKQVKNTDDDKGDYRSDNKEQKTSSDVLSEWIEKNFKNVGDQSMFSSFDKIRDWLIKQEKDHNLALKHTPKPADFSSLVSSEKHFVCF